MCHDLIAKWCGYIALATGVLAGVAWYIAARHPVAVPGLPFYAPSDRKHRLWAEIEAHGMKIARGGKWNLAAALITCVSGVAAVSAVLLPGLVCR